MNFKRWIFFALLCLGTCQAQSPWSLKNGHAIDGTVLRITPGGDAVVRTSSGISNVSLNEFDQASIKKLEKQFATLDLKKLADGAKPRSQQRALRNVQGWDELSDKQKAGVGMMGFGMIAALLGWILLLIAAFKENPMWGIAILLFGIAGFIFFILHFNKAKLAFLFTVLGTGGLIGGALMVMQAVT